ncbi:hypothetical protein [Paucibacter soli]|uniref:hypothetical protein n=1 Tax=Paucibacter soli TaxID=3133433 RepID=UPI0030B08F99
MSSQSSQAGAEDIDAATIDGDVVGISPGHGELAALLSWHHAFKRDQLTAGVSFEPVGLDLEPSAVMGSLMQYAREHRMQLSGSGLILDLEAQAPAPAFPTLIDLHDKSRHDATSYAPKDYADGSSAGRHIGEIVEAFPNSRQACWLLNATMVRASLQMATFAYGDPEVKLNQGDRPHQVLFTSSDRVEAVTIDKSTSPLSFHREVRKAIQGIWRSRLAATANQVSNEFADSLAEAGLQQAHVARLRSYVLDFLNDAEPYAKLRSSSAAFINIRRISEACVPVVESLDRVAIRNALRHGASGLTWNGYEIHQAPAIKEEIAAFENLGALAYSRYSAGLLELLSAASSRHVGFGFGFAGDPADSARAEARFTGEFMKSLSEGCSEQVLETLAASSPRYFCGIATSHQGRPSLAEHVSGPRGLDNQDYFATAQVAGARLANALNQVAASSRARAFLPWTRVLMSESAYELMTDPCSDEAASRGLSGLIQYANTRRSKGDVSDQVIFQLPSRDELLDAPDGCLVASIQAMRFDNLARSAAAGTRSALKLVTDFLAAMASSESARIRKTPTETSSKWTPKLAALRLLNDMEPNLESGFRLGLLHPQGRVNLWSQATVLGRTNEGFSRGRLEHATDSYFAFAVRGKGTPEGVAPLVFQIHVPADMRFKPLAKSSSKKDPAFNLELTDIAGTGITKAMMRVGPSPLSEALHSSLADEQKLELARMAKNLKATIARFPLQAACLFPAAAVFVLAGGRLNDSGRLPVLGGSTALRLARCTLGTGNPAAMELICRNAGRPAAVSASGVGLLDIALECPDASHAESALRGLKANGKLASGELAQLVQRSLGKLTERHPTLLSAALELGAIADPQMLKAWTSLHPHRKTPELSAQVDAASMAAVIATRLSAANDTGDGTNQSPQPTARRRARAL